MKKYLSIVFVFIFFTSCSIKQNDALLIKTTKQTVNTPVYIVKEVTPIISTIILVVGIIGLEILSQNILQKNNIKYYP